MPQKHYEDTIEKRVSLERLWPYLPPEDGAGLSQVYPSATAPTWGAVPSNESRWRKINPGDIVLFCGDKKVFASAIVRYKARSRRAAEQLWEAAKDGSRFELLYFVDDVRSEDIPMTAVNGTIGYELNYRVPRLNVLAPRVSARVLAAFPLERQEPGPSLLRQAVSVSDGDGGQGTSGWTACT